MQKCAVYPTEGIIALMIYIVLYVAFRIKGYVIVRPRELLFLVT